MIHVVSNASSISTLLVVAFLVCWQIALVGTSIVFLIALVAILANRKMQQLNNKLTEVDESAKVKISRFRSCVLLESVNFSTRSKLSKMFEPFSCYVVKNILSRNFRPIWISSVKLRFKQPHMNPWCRRLPCPFPSSRMQFVMASDYGWFTIKWSPVAPCFCK